MLNEKKASRNYLRYGLFVGRPLEGPPEKHVLVSWGHVLHV